MSYIRCLSNPEGLYVYGDGKDVNFHWCVKPPFASPGGMKIPHDIFTKAGQKWADQYCSERVSVRGFVIEEVHVYEKNAKKVGEMSRQWVKQYLKDKRPTRSGWKLSYRGKFIILWPVTMHYMMDRFVNEHRDRIMKMQKRRR